MNRSAPVDAQDARAAIEPATDRAQQPAGAMPKAASIAAAVVALALLCYAGLWALTALQLRAGVLDWIAARQAEGYRVAYSRFGLGGFPTVARVTVKAPAVAAPDGRALSWSWVGSKAVLEVNPLRRDGLTVRLGGEEIVSINVDGKLRTYRGGADELAFSAREAPGSGARRLVIRNLAMTSEEPGDLVEIEQLSASAEAAGEHAPTRAAVPAYAVVVEGAGIRLPRQLDLPLGELFSHVSARALVKGTVVPAGGDLPAVLSRWRASGGTAEVSHLGLHYGPLVLEGSGTASLDGGHLHGPHPRLSADPLGARRARHDRRAGCGERNHRALDPQPAGRGRRPAEREPAAHPAQPQAVGRAAAAHGRAIDRVAARAEPAHRRPASPSSAGRRMKAQASPIGAAGRPVAAVLAL